MLNSGYILDKKYEVIKTLGQGGMSTVYLCKNIRLGNLWAIKEVSKELKGQMDFLAEPNILKNLSHPGIPRVVDIFYEQDNLYMVEDYIEGETLESYIDRNRPIDDQKICRIVISIGDIVAYLHSFDPPIIYRDLKPSNIMITSSGKIVLIDFGISRVYKQDGNKDTIYMGSRGYAAPEQYGSEQTCKQTDIYGLGAVMYFIIKGKAPSTLFEALKDESYDEKVDDRLKAVIQKAMQIDKDTRYISIEELQSDISNFLSGNDAKTVLINNRDISNYTKTLLIDGENIKNNIDDSFGTKVVGKKATISSSETKVTGIKNTFNNEFKNKPDIDKSQETKNVDKLKGDKIRENKLFKGKSLQSLRFKGMLKTKGLLKFILKKRKNKQKKNEKTPDEGNNKASKKLVKRIMLPIIGIFIVAAAIYLVTDHGKKYDYVANVDKDNNQENISNSNTQPSKSDASQNKNINVQKSVPKDTIVEGIINKNSPITLGNSSNGKDDEKSKGNGKAKGKYKQDNKGNNKDKEAKDIAYQVDPAALCGKNSNRLIMKLQYVEFRGNETIVYCYLENNTDKKISIKHDGNTYLVNDKNQYVQATTASSTDLSNIAPGAKVDNIKISFTNFNSDTKKITLKTNINSDSTLEFSKEINLIINVK
ncbi:serine/threonine-protein kinase [Clostridium sp. OS1-26]|uniref:serine/threonine-protein kinase n=1 Tax=Clostridium sp. OS1-26 TaxID=3070681 RepID=UPI0027E1B4F0|nr:serine/threonine-protein kinase [Clostridium sp. OS1-26]WML36940.1 serine/threonine-protein kinase [Clostridium sp. OS1-26]